MLHVVNTSDTGGAQTLIEALAANAGANLSTHVCVLSAEGALADRLREVADSVTHLGSTGRTSDVARLAAGLRGVVRRIRPDVLHSHLFQSNLLAAAFAGRDIPHVWTVHTSGHGTRDRMRTQAVVRALRPFARRADAVVACSPTAAEWVGRQGWTAEDVPIVPNGVHVPAPADLPVRSGAPYILSLARAHEMKDHANLFAAFALVGDDTELVCAGLDVAEGTPIIDAALASVPADVRSRIRLLGSVDDPRALTRSARALVLSSSYGEALPMAALEALSVGTPVVTTDVGDCRMAATDPRLIVPPSDPHALATAIASVTASGTEAYAAMRREARALGQTFDIRRTVERYRAIYELATA
ncbi:glycosyltransferase [Nocardioides thalensis]|uniref:glycosyltransferase n=1 Tax=Nocardioides thalensis TaxID=1914755 RepID=UPI0031B619E3